jgi:hypothetical protein
LIGTTLNSKINWCDGKLYKLLLKTSEKISVSGWTLALTNLCFCGHKRSIPIVRQFLFLAGLVKVSVEQKPVRKFYFCNEFLLI